MHCSEGQLHNLNDEINYFMEVEHAKDYDIAVQLHLNAFNSQAYGCEAYAYNDKGLEVANAICIKLGTVWHNRGGQIKTELYWTRKTKAMSVLVESFFVTMPQTIKGKKHWHKCTCEADCRRNPKSGYCRRCGNTRSAAGKHRRIRRICDWLIQGKCR